MNIYKLAVVIFGKHKQALRTLEELNELGIELSRYGLKDERFDRQKVLEEFVDVQIMLNQLVCIFNFTDAELEQMRSMKLEKLRKRLKGDINGES